MLAVMLLILAAVSLTACTRDFDETDVKKYIRDELHISSYKILSGPEENTDEDVNVDQTWTVSTDVFDLGEDLIFHVYNESYWDLEWTSSRLASDLHLVKQRVLLEDCVLPDGVRLEEEKNSSGRIWNVFFVYPLSGREDFANAISAVTTLQSSFKSIPSIIDTDFYFSLKVDSSDPITEAGILDRVYSVRFNGTTAPSEISDSFAEQSDHYLMDCIEQGLLGRMDEYSIGERSAVINAQSNNTEIRRIDETTAAYPGYAYNFYYDIPYGTLYRILEQEGYELTGDWKSFSFMGSDGEVHAYAYGDNKNVISVDEINEVTGLNLDDAAQMLEVAVDSNLLGLFGEDADAFASKLLALDGDYFREVKVTDGAVHIRGKGRQFARLSRLVDDRLSELKDELRRYDGGYGFVYDNMSRVYQGIKIRFGTDVPIETARRVIDEAVALTAFNQILNQGRVYNWDLEVTFATWKDSQSENVMVYTLPKDEIDYEAVYRALRKVKS